MTRLTTDGHDSGYQGETENCSSPLGYVVVFVGMFGAENFEECDVDEGAQGYGHQDGCDDVLGHGVLRRILK